MKLEVQGHAAYAYTGGKTFDATLPCVVFVHGALHDHSVWTLLARWCAHHGFSVLAVDLPGHARSAGAPPASVEAMGVWLDALLDVAGVRQAAFVGHSMGSLVALEAVARAPKRATRLVMIATAFPMKVSDTLLSTARDRPERAIEMVNVFSHSTQAAKPAYPGPGSWLHGGNRRLMQRLQGGQQALNLFAHDFAVCDAYENGLQAAAAVRCPVHFILGVVDAMTPPKAARELAAALKATVHRLPAGHSLMQEQPDGVLNVLRQALGGLA